MTGLTRDGLVNPVPGNRGYEDVYDTLVRLTAYGNAEVERWVSSPDTGTEHLPVSYNQTYNNFHAPVSGSSFVSGSSNVTINLNANYGHAIQDVVEKTERLLAQAEVDPDEREEVEADIVTVRQAAQSDAPDDRVRPALRRIRAWAVKAVAAGATAALSTEVQEAISHVLPQLT